MRLIFKERFFSWLDSYDIYLEGGQPVYTVEGKLAWGHKMEISHADGRFIGSIQEEVFTLLPRFNIYLGDRHVGEIKKEFTFFKPAFSVDCNGWSIEGDFFEWDYRINDQNGKQIAYISKEFLNFTDTYTIDIKDENDAIMVLMVVLAIDAAKCSNDK